MSPSPYGENRALIAGWSDTGAQSDFCLDGQEHDGGDDRPLRFAEELVVDWGLGRWQRTVVVRILVEPSHKFTPPPVWDDPQEHRLLVANENNLLVVGVGARRIEDVLWPLWFVACLM